MHRVGSPVRQVKALDGLAHGKLRRVGDADPMAGVAQVLPHRNAANIVIRQVAQPKRPRVVLDVKVFLELGGIHAGENRQPYGVRQLGGGRFQLGASPLLDETPEGRQLACPRPSLHQVPFHRVEGYHELA